MEFIFGGAHSILQELLLEVAALGILNEDICTFVDRVQLWSATTYLISKKCLEGSMFADRWTKLRSGLSMTNYVVHNYVVHAHGPLLNGATTSGFVKYLQ